jgi:hypothetical protein
LLAIGLLLAACGGDSDDTAEDALPSDPREAITVVLAAFEVVEQRTPVVLETRGDTRDTEFGGALVEIVAICSRAETMGEEAAAADLRRACDRLVYAGIVRAMASGNALLLLDGIEQARTVLAEYE